jgi:VanZ family protein
MDASAPKSLTLTTMCLYVLWILSIILVITGSLLPATSPVIRAIGRVPVSQKVLHFCAYTWLALLALLAIRRRSLALLVALSIILLGVALEFGQKLVPGRGFEVRDMFINGAGVLTGMVIGIFGRHIGPAVSRS